MKDKANDAAIKEAESRVRQLDEKMLKLLVDLAPELQRIRETAQGPDEQERAVEELEGRVAAAKTTENALFETLKTLEVENKQTGSDVLEENFAKAELAKDENLLMQIQGHIQQLEFEAKGPARVEKANMRTRVDPKPSPRAAVITGIPFLVLLCLVPLFVGIEALSGRRARANATAEEQAPSSAPSEEPQS